MKFSHRACVYPFDSESTMAVPGIHICCEKPTSCSSSTMLTTSIRGPTRYPLCVFTDIGGVSSDPVWLEMCGASVNHPARRGSTVGGEGAVRGDNGVRAKP